MLTKLYAIEYTTNMGQRIVKIAALENYNVKNEKNQNSQL